MLRISAWQRCDSGSGGKISTRVLSRVLLLETVKMSYTPAVPFRLTVRRVKLADKEPRRVKARGRFGEDEQSGVTSRTRSFRPGPA